MYAFRTATYALCAAILLFGGDACGVQQSAFPAIYDDPLLWDDFVAKGTVSKVEDYDLTAEQWFAPLVDVPQNHGPVQLIRIVLGDVDVLRGSVPPSDFSVVIHRPKRAEDELTLRERIRVGETLFVTGRYRPDKDLYVATTTRVEDSAGWRNILGDRWHEPITETDIRSRVSSVSVSRMSQESDLILRGRVVAHRKVGPANAPVDEYEIVPEKVLKGAASSSVVFHAGGGIAADESKWRMLFIELEPGSSWYFFLKHDGSSYIPTAGWRAAFRVDGGKLYERIDVPSSYTPSVLERDIVEFTSD